MHGYWVVSLVHSEKIKKLNYITLKVGWYQIWESVILNRARLREQTDCTK